MKDFGLNARKFNKFSCFFKNVQHIKGGSNFLSSCIYIISYRIVSYRIVSYHIISYHISYIISHHRSYHHIVSYISYHVSYHISSWLYFSALDCTVSFTVLCLLQCHVCLVGRWWILRYSSCELINLHYCLLFVSEHTPCTQEDSQG